MQIIAQLEATQSHWLANYTWNKKLQLLLNRNDKWFVKIKEKAIEYGGNVPFIRPKNLSGDNAKSIDVVIHSIDYLNHKV